MSECKHDWSLEGSCKKCNKPWLGHIIELEQKNTILRQRAEMSEKTIKRRNQEISEWIHKANDLVGEHDELKRQVEKLKQECHELRIKKISLDEFSAMLQRQAAACREALEKAHDAISSLGSHYGTNLQVHGWHLNGAPEPFDNFFDDNGLGEAMEAADQALSSTPAPKLEQAAMGMH